MTFEQLATAVQTIGVIGLLIVAVVGGFRRWYVWWWVYDAKVTECEEWKTLALRGIDTTHDMIAASKQHTVLTEQEARLALQVIREAGQLPK